MDFLSCGSGPCCQAVDMKWKLVGKCLNSRQARFPSVGNRSGSVRFHDNKELQRDFGSLSALEGSKRTNCKAYSESYDGYVIGGEEDVADISGVEEPATNNVVIPGLPDGSNGAPISSCFWEWKPKLNVHYEKAGCENVDSPHVLFLPGFGVGSFHYEKQLRDLGRDTRVWALDFLGQGLSLPFEDPAPHYNKEGATSNGNASSWGFGDETEPWATKLVYSIDLWQDQVRYFIEEVIGEPVYIVGNSLGGYVALYSAARNPHLVKGVTLLNATPFWGFLPNPIKNPGLAKFLPWAGTFPLPSNVKRLTELVWEKISDPASIAEVLNQVYAENSTNVDSVFSRIIETTRHPAAAAAFASIMFAPQAELSFSEALSRCQKSNVPICLMYGKEDPWVKPLWGLQVKRQVPEASYYQISPAGHCPHDEVPEVINFLLRGWIRNLESEGSISLPLLDGLDNLKQAKKPKKKKSLRKKDRLDINALEAEAVSSGLGVGDLGSRKDVRRQAIKDEQERLEAETRSNAYQSAYAKADEASKLLRLEQTLNVKEEDETPVFVDDDEDLCKSLEKARRLALKKEGEGASGPQAIALLATSNHNNETDDQNPTAGESRENKVVFTEMEEFVWGLHIDEEARKPESEDVFMHDDEETNVPDEENSNEAGGWTEVQETNEDEQHNTEDKEEIVPDETIHEVAVGKGLSGALKLLKERGTLKESIEWGGRSMDKKKSKLVGIVDDEEKEAQKTREIRIERTDEFGRILTPKEAFRMISHKFHGKGPGKMKQEKRMKQYHEELKMKQMKSSDTPSLSVERMREAQARLQTPYLVLSGHVKPGQTSDPKSGFATVEKDLPGGLTPMLGDRKVEHFLGIKRKAEPSSSDTPKKPKS